MDNRIGITIEQEMLSDVVDSYLIAVGREIVLNKNFLVGAYPDVKKYLQIKSLYNIILRGGVCWAGGDLCDLDEKIKKLING